MSHSDINKPNFFIVGAPKCGTTSLADYLGNHPNIFLCPAKEPNYFNFDSTDRLNRSLRNYLSLFDRVNPCKHKAVGEGSPTYLFSRVAVSEILKFNPAARFIAMLRNPVDLVQSLHSERCYCGLEDVIDFETAWRLEPARRTGKSIPRACLEPRLLCYSEWAQLGEQMERLYAIVPRERVKVILFDDFVADTKRVYEEVLSFLAVPSDHRTNFQIINPSKVVQHPRVQRGLAFIFSHYRRIRNSLGLDLNLRLGLNKALLELNSIPSARKPISSTLRAELADCFREDVAKLSQLLGRDLSHWVSSSQTTSPAQARRQATDS